MPLTPLHSIGHCFQTGCVMLTGLGKKVCTVFVDTAAKICRFVYNVFVPHFLKRIVERVIKGPRVNWPADPELMAQWDKIIILPPHSPQAAINLKNSLVKEKIEPLYFEHIFVSDVNSGFFGGDCCYEEFKHYGVETGKHNSAKTLFIKTNLSEDVNKLSINKINETGHNQVAAKFLRREWLPYLENSAFVCLSQEERGDLHCHELPKRLKRLFTTPEIKDRKHVFEIVYPGRRQHDVTYRLNLFNK